MARLPVLAILGASYADLARNLPAYLRLIPIPFAAALALAVTGVSAANADPATPTGLISIATELAKLALLIPVFTAWHRLVLLGVHDPNARLRYGFGPEEMFYLRKTAAILLLAVPLGLAIGIALALIGIVSGEINAVNAATHHPMFHTGFVILFLLIIAPRVVLLPAAARGEAIARPDARRLVAGQSGRIRLLVLIAWLPQGAIGTVIAEVLNGSRLASEILQLANSYLFLGIGIGVLSHSYVWLARRQSNPTADVSDLPAANELGLPIVSAPPRRAAGRPSP
jgi:hypothetical protein